MFIFESKKQTNKSSTIIKHVVDCLGTN